MSQPALINLHPNEYIEGISYYPFPVILDALEVINTLNNLSNRVCVPNKTEDLNLQQE